MLNTNGVNQVAKSDSIACNESVLTMDFPMALSPIGISIAVLHELRKQPSPLFPTIPKSNSFQIHDLLGC